MIYRLVYQIGYFFQLLFFLYVFIVPVFVARASEVQVFPYAGADFKYGLIDKTGRVIVPLVFDEVQVSADRTYLMKKLSDLVLIDSSNQFRPLNQLKYNGSIRFDFGEVNSTGLPWVIRLYDCFFYNWEGKLMFQSDKKFYTEAYPFIKDFALVKNGFKYNFINRNGELKSNEWYDFIGNFYDGRAMVGNGKWTSWGFQGIFGYIDTSGNPIIPIALVEASDFSNGKAKVRFHTYEAIIDTSGSIVSKLQLNNRQGIQSQILSKRNESERYILMGSKRSTPGKKNEIRPQGALIPKEMNQKWGYVEPGGKWVVEPQFDYTFNFFEGFGAVIQNSKWNFIDHQGKLINPNWFDDVESFKQGLAKVNHQGKYTYLGRDGKFLFEPMYPVKNISGGRAKIEDASGRERRYAYLGAEGQLVTIWLTGAEKYYNGLAEIKRDDGLYATIDTLGNIVDEWHFRVLFATDLFDLMECNNRYAFRDKNSTVMSEWKEDFEMFPEGFIAVRKDEKWGFIDKYGKVLIPFEYDECWNFKYGVAKVRKAKKFAFLDKNGRNITNDWFEAAGDFHDERAAVMKAKKWGFIDNTGRFTVKPIYSAAGIFSNGLAMVKKGSKFGFIDKNGKVVIPFEYDSAGNFNKAGLATVKKGKEGGEIDKKGNFTSNKKR